MKAFKKSKKVLSCILAGVMLIGTGNMPHVSAADSIPLTGEQGRKENQPRFNGYRIWDIRDWSPEADEGAEFLVAKVPLQGRNAAYKPTQVNPDLDSDGQIMLMQGDYGNAFVDGMMYNNTFGYHTLNYWQYVDYFSPWHGAASQDTPVDLHDWDYENTTNRGWEKRYFEFGVLNVPNPAYTNAAHRNGVMSIACLYFDQYYRPGQTINELFAMDEDGTFPVAEKLIEMADYFGYDGYFFNAEENVYPEYGDRKKRFLARLEEAGLYTQYYDTNSAMNASKAEWLEYEIDGVPTKIQDSVFVNYGWPGSFANHLKWMNENGIDPFEQAFYGVENNQGGFNGGHPTTKNIEELYTHEDGTKNLMTSVALFTPSDFYQRGLDGTKLQNTNYQWMIAERERMFFSGVKCDPTDTGDQTGYSRPDVEVDNAGAWPGVADFVAERSVVDGTVFHSNFSVGKGVQYFTDGAVSRDEEWSNINMQAILPTWQWWIDSEGASKLSADFDYGPKEVRKAKDGSPMALPYTQIGAYEGGNSLVVYGDVDGKNKLHLFKTDLEVKSSSKASITFQKTSNDTVSMKLGIILKDGTTNMVELAIKDSQTKGGWTTSEVDLSAYAGSNIAAIGLVFDGSATGYQMNIGSIKVTDNGNHTPAAPTGFQVDRAFTDDEMIVTWNLGDFNTVDRYEIYANLSDGEKVFVGGSFDDIYYIKSLDETDAVTLELVAVGKDGSKSTPATLTFDYKQSVSNLQVQNEVVEITVVESAVVKGHLTQSAEEGALNLSWTNPAAAYDHLEIKVTMDDSADTEAWTMTVPKGQNTARIEIPRYNGEKYNASVTAVLANGTRGEAMNVTGKVKDTYSTPFAYDGDNIRISGKSFTVWCPQAPDWFKLHISLDGTYLNFSNKFNAFTTPHAIRAGTMMTSTLPETSGLLEIVMEDYAGNFSEPYQALLQDGVFLDLNAEINESVIPDAVLRAYIKENVGTTVAEMLSYEGNVELPGTGVADLTGIHLLGKVLELDISDTAVSDFAPIGKLKGLQVLKANNTKIAVLGDGMLPDTLTELELSDCTALTQVNPGVLGKLGDLKALGLSGNTALKDLYLENVKAAIADISGNTAVTTLVTTGSSIREIDITASTKVVTLKLNDGNLEKITAAAGSAYTNIYLADFSGNKLDLSANTPEGILINEMKAYIAENPITPVEAEPVNVALGTTVTSTTGSGNPGTLVNGGTGYYSVPEGASVTVDLGMEQQIKKWKVLFDGSYYKADSFKMEFSSNGTDFTEIETITGNTEETVTRELNTPVVGRYFRYTSIKKVNSGPDLKEIELYAGGFLPSGIVYGNQRPAPYPNYNEIPKDITVTQDNKEVKLGDYVDACFSNPGTVRGNSIASLVGLDWIADDYDGSVQIAPWDITIVIIDQEGNEQAAPMIANAAGLYTVEFRNKEGVAMASMAVKVIADKTALHALIASCADLKEEDYTPITWTDFAEALAAAQTLAEEEFADQNDVDAAIAALTSAKDALTERAQKEALAAAIASVDAVDIHSHTLATVRVLKEALATAKSLYEDLNASQADVDAAVIALEEAIANLEVRQGKDDLVDLIAEAEALDLTLYTPKTADPVRAALEEAKTVNENASAEQSEINAAIGKLFDAMEALELLADKTQLYELIEEAEAIDLSKYTQETADKLTEALTSARAAAEDPNVGQTEVDEICSALKEAMDGLTALGDKTELNRLIEEAEAIDLSRYTEETAAKLKEALAAAKETAQNPNALQEEVDEACNALQKAMEGLVARPEEPGPEEPDPKPEPKPEEPQPKPEEPQPEPEEPGPEPDNKVIQADMEALLEAVAGAEEGTTIQTKATLEDILPAEVQRAIAGRDITLEITLENGITWVINGKDLSTEKNEDIWLKILYGDVSIGTVPASVIDGVQGALSYRIAVLRHSGEFYGKVRLRFPMGQTAVGKYGNLFYYNETTGKLEYIQSDLVGEDGIAVFELTHASQYVLYVSDKAMDQGSVVANPAPETPENKGDDTTSNPKTGDTQSPIAGFVLAVAALGMAAALFINKKKFLRS